MKTISRALLSLSLTLIKGATEEVDNSILKEKWHEYLHRPEIERELQARIIGGSDAPNGAYVSSGCLLQIEKNLSIHQVMLQYHNTAMVCSPLFWGRIFSWGLWI